MDDIYMDLGEKAHMVSLVRPVCGEEISFEIRSARWELYREDWGERSRDPGKQKGNVRSKGSIPLTPLIQPRKRLQNTGLSIFTRWQMRSGWM